MHKKGLTLVRPILLQSRKFEALHFEHIYRKANRCAYFLAKIGISSLEDCNRFDVCPLELRHSLVNDCACSSVRLVA